MKFLCANRIAPDGPRSAASHLGLYPTNELLKWRHHASDIWKRAFALWIGRRGIMLI